jgi:prevent-host-death family protein
VVWGELTDDISKFLRLAETEQIVITRHGNPAGVLIGFGTEDDWSRKREKAGLRKGDRSDIRKAGGKRDRSDISNMGRRFYPSDLTQGRHPD